MPRPIQATIDLPALRHNLAACRAAAIGRKVWAVIKANAYGHGIENAVRAFATADGLALLDLAEAAARAGRGLDAPDPAARGHLRAPPTWRSSRRSA